MTDDVLLKKIEEIIAPLKQDVSGLKQDMQVVKQDLSGLKQDFEGQIDLIGARLQYLEHAERALVRLFESLNDKQKEAEQSFKKLLNELWEVKEEIIKIKTEQQAQGKTLKDLKPKVNRIDKTVDIIGKRYDERIVHNAREIVVIKEYLGLPAKH